MFFYKIRFKFLSIFLALSLTACFHAGDEGGNGDNSSRVESKAIAFPTALPAFSPIVGRSVLIDMSATDTRYRYSFYASTDDFTDKADAKQIFQLDGQRSLGQPSEIPLETLGLTELDRDYTLYVRIEAFNTFDNTFSELSEPIMVKLLASPADLSELSAAGDDVTIEWPVEAGKSYNVYYSLNPVSGRSLGSSTKLAGGPFTSGKETFSVDCSTTCNYYFGVTAVEGNSESNPIALYSPMRVSNAKPSLFLGEKTGESVTVSRYNSGGMPDFRIYYATETNATPETATLLYDSDGKNDGTYQVEHTINTSISEQLTYYYFIQSYSELGYANSSGVVKTFSSVSPLSEVVTYLPTIADFRLKNGNSLVGGSSGLQKLGDSLFWNLNGSAIEYSLGDSDYVYTPIIGSQVSLLIDNAGSSPVFYSANLTEVGKTISESNRERLTVSIYGDEIVDMVQTSTDLYVLTKKRVLKVAKANVRTGGTYNELATGLSDATDIEINKKSGTLYVADNNGVISLPFNGGDQTILSADAATFLSLDDTGENLYVLHRDASADIRKIDFTSSNDETVIKRFVGNSTNTGLLKIYGNWLYFSAGSNTYRLSLTDTSVMETVAPVNAISLFPDESAGEGTELYVISSDKVVYHFPEVSFPADLIPPSEVGSVTTAPSDSSIYLTITPPTGQTIDFYMVNGAVVPVSLSGDTETLVSNLTNGQLSDIEISAFNLAGQSTAVTVQDTPVIAPPTIKLFPGANTGLINVRLDWTNPVNRELTVNIYRSQTLPVDISGTPVFSTTSTTIFTNYADNGLSNGTLYYYRATLDDGSTASSEMVGTVPYKPYTHVNDSANSPASSYAMTIDGNLFWGSSRGIYFMDGNTPTVYLGADGAALGVNTIGIVRDSFGFGDTYLIKTNASQIYKIENDFSVGGMVESSYVDLGFTLDYLSLDAINLYVAGSGQIKAVSLIDKSTTDLYSTTSPIREVSLAGTYIYWLEGNAIKRMPKAGGTVETLVTATGDVKDMEVASNGDVFYSMQSEASILYFSVYKYDSALKTVSVVTDNAAIPKFAVADDILDSGKEAVFAFLRRLPVAGVDYIELAKFSVDDGTETVVKSGGPFDTMNTGSDIYVDGSSYYLLGGGRPLYKIQ